MATNLLFNPEISQRDWIEHLIKTIVLPKFTQKNVSYGKGMDEFHNMRQSAQRFFPNEYQSDPWAAMAKVAALLKDKHEVSLAKDVNVPEAEERMLDCIVYDLFRLRFKLMQFAGKAECSLDLEDQGVQKLFKLEEDPCQLQSISSRQVNPRD